MPQRGAVNVEPRVWALATFFHFALAVDPAHGARAVGRLELLLNFGALVGYLLGRFAFVRHRFLGR